MRISKAWTVASKDFKSFWRRKGILYSIIGFELFVSVGLPFIVRFIAGKPEAAVLLSYLMNTFAFMFVISAVLTPTAIASYSLVGEKVQKSLEPLLATPATDEEILLGKSMSAFIPAMASTFIAAMVFTFLSDWFTYSVFQYLFYPNWQLVVMLFLLAPLACILSVGFNILISARVSDVRSAQQLGALIILPFGAVYFLSELQVFPLTTDNLLILAAVLAVLDGLIFYLARATFQRDEILTRWK